MLIDEDIETITITPNYQIELYIPYTFMQYNNARLTEMPDLSNYKNLRKLNINNHQIRDLGILPDTLQELYCYNNQITNFSNLPTNLKILNCSNNRGLISLDNLPIGLEYLNCSCNAIQTLDFLPIGLQVLECTNMCLCNDIGLNSLDYLPFNLKKLMCGGNNIKSLNNLPSELIYLDCSYNFGLHLDNIPSTVKELVICGIASANIINNNIAIYR